jgi:hypothetical protein
MRRSALVLQSVAAAAMLLACAGTPTTPTGPMGFFVTSAGPGKGGDLGGLAGADRHCQALASAVGAGSRTWRAYLSTSPAFATQTAPAVPSVNARDRIGKGPWFNARGALIARDLAHLHNGNHLDKSTALDEMGRAVSGRGDAVNNHDILTGSRVDGTAFAPQTDTTCGNWTKSGDGAAIVGHHDRIGPLPENWATSWNFSHPTVGCGMDALRRTGGAGLFYCFAAD